MLTNNEHTMQAQPVNTVPRDRSLDRQRRQNLVNLDRKTSDLSGFKAFQISNGHRGFCMFFDRLLNSAVWHASALQLPSTHSA